jgi:hypothetical protein
MDNKIDINNTSFYNFSKFAIKLQVFNLFLYLFIVLFLWIMFVVVLKATGYKGDNGPPDSWDANEISNENQ